MNLRDFILDGLSFLPGKRTIHLTVLVSHPRRDADLFAYATSQPKVYVQDILLLVSEHPPNDSAARVLVSAVEAKVYNFPATASAILYISKVDSTGQQYVHPPLTRTLVRALLQYYTSATTRPAPNVWVQLFARSQTQYLFPNSSEAPQKRVLSDAQLCRWWKGVLDDVAQKSDPASVRLFYLLPGYSSLEATHMLSILTPPSTPVPWSYTHPYIHSDILLPFGPISDGVLNIAELIPSFPDDPKARFLSEIATSVEAPVRHERSISASPDGLRKKRPRPADDVVVASRDKKEKEKEKEKNKTSKALLAVSPSEFWERMAFRQECSQGAVTGFFTAIFSSLPSSSSTLDLIPHQIGAPPPQIGQVPGNVVARITSSLLNQDCATKERTIRATEVLEDVIRGLCSGPEVGSVAPAAPASEKQEQETTVLEHLDVERSLGQSLYESSIAGFVEIDNPELLPRQLEDSVAVSQPVNVLQVRKKKRPAPS